MTTQQALEGARLDNNANNSSHEDSRRRRRERFALRYGLNRITTLDRPRKCGRCSRVSGGTVEVRVRDGVAGFAGLVSCGSVWVCPVCAAKIAQRRAIQIGLRVAAAWDRGLSAMFMTNTVRHSRDDALVELLDALAYGWGRMTSGVTYSKARAAAGVVGYSRALEITYGPNGWHPHLHSLWFSSELHTQQAVEDFAYPLWCRFDQGVQKAGLRSTQIDGQDWQLVTPKDEDGHTLAKYLQKVADPAGLGYELTHTQSKTARRRNSTEPHWSLLAQAVHGVTPDLWLWHEYEKATHGRKQLVNSLKLDELLGVTVDDATDDEIAAEELGSQDDALCVISAEGWARLVMNLPLMLGVLDAAVIGQDTLSDLLASNNIDHERV